MMIEPLELDWNAYVQQCVEDLMRSPDPWNKKETIWSLQTATCTYAGLGVRESNKKFPEAKRNAQALKTLQEVALPGLIACLKMKGFPVPTDAYDRLMKTTMTGEISKWVQ